jgi:hypothetical protein
MNCQLFESRVSEWIDAQLTPDEHVRMLQHAEGCAPCRKLEQELRGLVSQLQHLPPEIEAPATQWPAVRARLEATSRASSNASRWPWLAVAAAVLVGVVGLTLWRNSTQSMGPTPQSENAEQIAKALATPIEVPLPAELAAVDAALKQARTQLDHVLQQQRGSLSPDTVRIVERNLRVMEDATREIRVALSRDPGSSSLRQMLVASHRRQLAMLQQVTRMTASQEKPK